MIGSENILRNHVRRAILITLIIPSGGGSVGPLLNETKCHLVSFGLVIN